MSDWPEEKLPCDFRVGHAVFRKGVAVRLAQEAVTRMHSKLWDYQNYDPVVQKAREEWKRVKARLHDLHCKCEGCEAYKDHTS